MSVAVLHRDDLLPVLPAIAGLRITEERSVAVLAALQSRDEEVIAARFSAGHRAYVATIDGEPAAFGWVATREATIGELGLSFTVPDGERYLWNFVTLPSFRGRGVYPRLLQAIVHREAETAERFWAVYAPENHASERGILAAGFTRSAELSFDASGGVALRGDGGLFGASTATTDLTPCWRCARAGRQWLMRCAPGDCQCDYQRPQFACH